MNETQNPPKPIIKLSHSSVGRFGDCPKQWELHYQKRLRSQMQGSALYFGKAIDESLNYMLENFKKESRDECIKNSLKVFDDHWKSQKDSLNNLIDLTKNITIEYSKWDFDSDLMTKKEWAQILSFNSNAFDSRNVVLNEPTNATVFDLETNAFMSWLTLSKKGKLFVIQYYDTFIDLFDEVVTVQQEFKISDGDNGVLNGFIDLVVKLKDGRIVVLDNKTSSVEYDANSVKESIQLSIYKQVLEIMSAEGSYKGPLPTHAGYCVISKKLDKTIKKTCSVCGTVTDNNKLKSCDAETANPEAGELVEGSKKKKQKDVVRCGGKFDKDVTIVVPTQFIVDEIPQSMVDLVLENVDSVKKCIENGVFPRNFSACVNKYGKTCPYYNYCRNNDSTGLTIMPERE